jgi:hypothetical protein
MLIIKVNNKINLYNLIGAIYTRRVYIATSNVNYKINYKCI